MDGAGVGVAVAEREGVNLQELKKKMAEFSRERDWDQFHSLLNLLLALSYVNLITLRFDMFYEHHFVSNLLRLLMISILCYITLLFFYLLFKLGIFQYRRGHCHRRHQFQDIKQDFSSSKENDLWDNYHNLNVSRKRKSVSRRRKDRLQSSIYPSSRHVIRSHRHVRLRSQGRSVQVVGRSRTVRSSRRLQFSKVRNVRRQVRTSKRSIR
ncbi:uncharacterized protein [Pyrus communis]|uniref:uncharacterized protein n=1 Tax=Pyrus communis TaxID=23211 RepID=UPI0035C10BB4